MLEAFSTGLPDVRQVLFQQSLLQISTYASLQGCPCCFSFLIFRLHFTSKTHLSHLFSFLKRRFLIKVHKCRIGSSRVIMLTIHTYVPKLCF
jgi:hypothetical protein